MIMITFYLTNSSIVSFSRVSHLRNLRLKIAGSIIFSYLNINFIRNKFENLCELVAGNLDILCIAETKLDPRSRIRYFKSSLPSKMLSKFKLPNNIHIIHFELNLRKDKWLFC